MHSYLHLHVYISPHPRHHRHHLYMQQSGAYAWKHHKRLRIKLINAEGHETVVPQLVLNEVRGIHQCGW